MNKFTALNFALISLIFCMPAHALQIFGTEEGESEEDRISFTEIYQDGHLVRLESGQLSYRFHNGKCLIADNEHSIYIENSCKKIAEEMAKQIKKQFATVQVQNNESLSAALKITEMLKKEDNNLELKKSGSEEFIGFNTTTYSTGPSKYWVSADLLSKIKKEVDFKGILIAQQQMSDAYSQIGSMFNIMEKEQRIEAELMAKGYLMKQISSNPMSAAMLNMLPPEARNAIMADMDEGSVVLEVTSVKYEKVNIEKYKPAGRKVSIPEYMETIFSQ